MKRILTLLVLAVITLAAAAQGNDAFEQLKANPKKAYGTDCPYPFDEAKMTKAPKGYKPFYISHYGRHGSRYYWNPYLYRELDSLLTTAHKRNQLTAEQVFKKGGNVLAVSSLSGRCVLSMSAFCQELVQCNPKIEIREQSSKFTLDAVVPDDRQNPIKHSYPKVQPRFKESTNKVPEDTTIRDRIISRVFTSTEGLPGNMHHIGSNLINLYTSLPNIGHEGMMGNIVTDDEIVQMWESSNLGSYDWVFGPQLQVIPILQDILKKADAVFNGSSNHIADLRFGHDSYLGPLTVLMGINGADRDPLDPFEVKNCYQNWETCDDILVKCLLNGVEATLPVPTTCAPYYKWSDFRNYYTEKISKIK